MTIEMLEKEESKPRGTEETKEIIFRCKYCGNVKPLDEMRTLTGFFPLVVACSECEKKMR